HFGAGIVLLLMGNLPEADRAFSTACQLAPGDPMAQNMLATVRSMEGASVGGPAAGPAPAPMPAWSPQPGGGGIPQAPPEHAGGSGWLEKINEVCTTIDKVVGTIGNLQCLVQGSQGGGGSELFETLRAKALGQVRHVEPVRSGLRVVEPVDPGE